MPGFRPAKAMYAGLYGELAPRPQPDPAADATMDAYSLFKSRSAAMGLAASAGIAEWAQGISQDVFDCDSVSLTEAGGCAGSWCRRG